MRRIVYVCFGEPVMLSLLVFVLCSTCPQFESWSWFGGIRHEQGSCPAFGTDFRWRRSFIGGLLFAKASPARLALSVFLDEAEILLEQRRLQEQEVWNVFEQHMESWELVEKKIESVGENAWHVTRAVIQKERIWNKTGTL